MSAVEIPPPPTDDDAPVELAPRRSRRGRPERIPPHNLDAEQAVLGAMLLSKRAVDAVVEMKLSPDDFYRSHHQHVFAAMMALVAQAARTNTEPNIDVVTVADILRVDQLLDDIGGPGFLLELQAVTPAISNARNYAQIVADTAVLRRLIRVAGDIAERAYTEADSAKAVAACNELLAAVRPAERQALALAGIVDWDDLFDADHGDAEWLAEPFLAGGGRATALFAPAKSRKSLLSFSVAAAVATGRPIFGQRNLAGPRKVLYLDYEMTKGDLLERTEAMGYTPDELRGKLFHALLPAYDPLNTPAGGAQLLADCKALGVVLVVIDTFSRVVAGAENDSDPFREYYAHTGRPLKAAGISVLRLDHAGKEADRGQRGSSAKNDDVDVVWQVATASDSGMVLKRTHTRMGWIPELIELSLHTEPLRYELAGRGHVWPAGTKELADRLTELGVPLDATAAEATRALKAADGKAARRQLVLTALRWRKHEATPLFATTAPAPTDADFHDAS